MDGIVAEEKMVGMDSKVMKEVVVQEVMKTVAVVLVSLITMPVCRWTVVLL